MAVACGGEDAAEASDAGAQVVDASAPDGAATDAAIEFSEEVEPNSGATATEFNMVSLPVASSGAIALANDIDIFCGALNCGRAFALEHCRRGPKLRSAHGYLGSEQ